MKGFEVFTKPVRSDCMQPEAARIAKVVDGEKYKEGPYLSRCLASKTPRG